MFPDLTTENLQHILKEGKTMTTDDAIFRNCEFFRPANLKNHLPFWEYVILKDHPHKQTILKRLQGVQIEEFLNSFTKGTFQDMELNSYYPAPQHFDNYVSEEFFQFMDENVQEWVNLGVLEKWDEVKSPGDPEFPTVVCPLGWSLKNPEDYGMVGMLMSSAETYLLQWTMLLR